MDRRKNETLAEFKARRKAYDHARRAANPEANRNMVKAWREANVERKRERNAEWRNENPGRMKELRDQWKARNKHRLSVHKQTRRAREAGSAGTLSADILARLNKLQRGRCANCGEVLRAHHLDHIIPLALGGRNEDANVQLLCPICNLRKSAKHPIEFAQQEGRLL